MEIGGSILFWLLVGLAVFAGARMISKKLGGREAENRDLFKSKTDQLSEGEKADIPVDTLVSPPPVTSGAESSDVVIKNGDKEIDSGNGPMLAPEPLDENPPIDPPVPPLPVTPDTEGGNGGGAIDDGRLSHGREDGERKPPGAQSAGSEAGKEEKEETSGGSDDKKPSDGHEPAPPPKPERQRKKTGGKIQRDSSGQPRNSPPGIVCWKNSDQQWVVGVEARPGLTNLRVIQNGASLEKEKIPLAGGAEAFVCHRLDVPVEVVWDEDGKEKTCSPRTPCEKGGFTIFSMKNDWQGIGRRIRAPAAGRCCIVIAPRDWERIGRPQVNDEAFLDDEYRTHYFKPEHGERDGFRLLDGREKPLNPKRGRFELQGQKMSGIHPDTPPLFGNAPPHLRDKQKWSRAAEIVVGGENLDARDSPPQSGDCDLDSLPKLKQKRGGFFAVRVDDDKGDSLDAQLDFKFIRGLCAIDIRGVHLLSGPNGHGTAKIIFQGDCEIVPKELCQGVEFSEGVATIVPRPDNDQTQWEIRDGSAKVEVDILLERIWWARGLEKESPTEWTSCPLRLTSKDVSLSAKDGLLIKLPREGFATNVYIGFPGAMNPYPVTARKDIVFAPLKEFVIGAGQGGREIKIGLGLEDKAETVAIARIVDPNVRGSAEVVRRGGRRDGKGFSLSELAAAGWTPARARRENLPVDTRRKTVHNWNIDALVSIGENPQ